MKLKTELPEIELSETELSETEAETVGPSSPRPRTLTTVNSKNRPNYIYIIKITEYYVLLFI